MFPISYRNPELMLPDRSVMVVHTTVSHWIQAYAVELEKRTRPHLRMSDGSWPVDETYVKVKGRRTSYRSVNDCAQIIDFRLRRRPWPRLWTISFALLANRQAPRRPRCFRLAATQSVEIDVNYRRREQRQRLRHNQPAHDGVAQGLAELR